MCTKKGKNFPAKTDYSFNLRRSQLRTTEHRSTVSTPWLNLFFIFQSLATGVVQLFLALPQDRTRWTHIITGVVCLVKDGISKSYYITVLDPKVSIVSTGLQRICIRRLPLIQKYFCAVYDYAGKSRSEKCVVTSNFLSGYQ